MKSGIGIYEIRNLQVDEDKKSSIPEERSTFKENESSRSSSAEAPPSKKRSITSPDRRSPSPS
jgi:hypothetical protein